MCEQLSGGRLHFAVKFQVGLKSGYKTGPVLLVVLDQRLYGLRKKLFQLSTVLTERRKQQFVRTGVRERKFPGSLRYRNVHCQSCLIKSLGQICRVTEDAR